MNTRLLSRFASIESPSRKVIARARNYSEVGGRSFPLPSELAMELINRQLHRDRPTHLLGERYRIYSYWFSKRDDPPSLTEAPESVGIAALALLLARSCRYPRLGQMQKRRKSKKNCE